MRVPIRIKKQPRTQTVEVQSRSAPLGGWNARDALADMNPHDAIVLNNWFPRTSYCEIRGGLSSHATGMTGIGKTLAAYSGIAGTSQFYCFTNSGVYDVSAPGAVGASKLARTNGRHQVVMFGDGSSNWLIATNGTDAPAYYDGTTWTAVTNATSPALTGITTSDLISVNVFKGRLFFIQKSSLSFWYLASGLAGGALTEFDLSGEAKRGGYLVGMATWTRDAGDGMDDVAVFMTSEGEAILYQGTNPSSSANWSKVGTFFIGKPLGRRCFAQYGGDVVVLTQNGAYLLSAALQTAQIDTKFALSYKVENAFTEAARSYFSTFGWEATVLPMQSALLVNVPVVEDGEHQQYVMNTITKSWCKFTGWNVESFGVYNGQLYAVSGTTVYKAWDGTSDAGTAIVAYGKTAFSYFGAPVQQKRFTLYRPVLAVNGGLTYYTDLDVDYADDPDLSSSVYALTTAPTWDVSRWDEVYWASGLQIVKQWTSPDEWTGFSAAGKLRVTTSTLIVQWMSNDYVYEIGNVI